MIPELDELINSKIAKDAEAGVWMCFDCDYRSNNLTHIKNHVEGKHIDSGGFSCHICGKISKTRVSLQMHVLRQHSRGGRSDRNNKVPYLQLM